MSCALMADAAGIARSIVVAVDTLGEAARIQQHALARGLLRSEDNGRWHADNDNPAVFRHVLAGSALV